MSAGGLGGRVPRCLYLTPLSVVGVQPSLPPLCLPRSPGAPASPHHTAPVPARAALAWPGLVLWLGGGVGVGLCVWLLPLRVSGSSVHSLKEQKNLNSFFAIMFGLSNSAISRLAHTWEVSAICWVGQGPTSALSQAPACPGGPGLEWGPHPRGVTAPPASPSQRLPHKVRKLYSALERLLVSALCPRHPGPSPCFFPSTPVPVLCHFPGF